MESTWYLSPGQTLENTRIEDRGHALHVTNKSWSKITGHLDRKRLIQESIDKEKEHRRMLKEGSEGMTKNWDNSVQNIWKRKEEERVQNLIKSEDEKLQRFFELRKEQAIEKDKFVQAVRKKMYVKSDAPKALTSALLFSEVLYTRDKQMEMDNFIQAHEKKVEDEYAAKVKQGALDEKREKEEREAKIADGKKQLHDYYITEISQKAHAEKQTKEARIRREIEESASAAREITTIKEIEIEEEKRRRANIIKELEDFQQQQVRAKEQQDQIDVEQEAVIEIYCRAKHRIECLRAKKEREIQEAIKKRSEAAAKKVVGDAKARQELEERILKKAIAERIKAEDEIREQKEAYQKMLKDEIQKDIADYKRNKALADQKDKELKKWSMINRFKKEESEKKYDSDKSKQRWEAILAFRRQLLEQIAENAEARRIEEERWEAFLKAEKMNDNTDELFFAYAKEVYDHAKSRGRSTRPIERAIMEYKKKNDLPVPKKPCESNLPAWAQKMEFVNRKPGSVQHDPKTDPTLGRTADDKNFLYK